LLATSVALPFPLYALTKRLKSSFVKLFSIIPSTSLILLLLLAVDFSRLGSLSFKYSWIPQYGVSFGLLLDGLSLPLLVAAASITLLSMVYSALTVRSPEYYFCFSLFYAGVIGVLLAVDLLQFYVFWELMLVPCFFIILFWGSPGRAHITAYKFFFFTHVGSILILIGFIMIGLRLGSLSMADITLKLSGATDVVLTQATLLITIGFLIKLAVFPLHAWLPDAYCYSPLPLTVVMSSVMMVATTYGIFRIPFGVLGVLASGFAGQLMLIGVVSMVYGSAMALAQRDLRRMLSYSSISHAGYVVFGASTLTTLGLAGSIFYALNSAICKGLLFMCSGVYGEKAFSEDLEELRGVAVKMPLTSTFFLLAALSLGGLPPFAGFIGEWMLFGGGFQRGWIYALLAVAGALLTFPYFLWAIYRMFVSSSIRSLENVTEANWRTLIPLLPLGLATVILGVAPSPVLEVLYPVVEAVTP